MKFINHTFLLLLAIGIFACTNLEEELREDLTGEQAQQLLLESADVSALLQGAYEDLRALSRGKSNTLLLRKSRPTAVFRPPEGQTGMTTASGVLCTTTPLTVTIRIRRLLSTTC